MISCSRAVRWTLCLSLAWPALAVAESASGAESREVQGKSYSFDDTVEIQLVNVEVYVTDRKGRPVNGLTADDFEVREDGRTVAISHFAELRRGVSVAETEASPAPSAVGEPEVSRTAPAQEPPHLVLYIDNQHLRPAGRGRVMKDLRSFLRAQAVPAERVMMLSQSPHLVTEVPFGSSLDDLDAALERMKDAPALGLENDRDRRLVMLKVEEIWEQISGIGRAALDPCDEIKSAGLREVQSYARRVRGRVSTTLGHLADVASSLAGVPGVKSLLYVGDGLELQPGSDLLFYLGDICPHITDIVQREANNHDLADRFKQLTQHANANRVTFYPMEAIGLRGSSSAGVEFSRVKFTPSAANDQIRTSNLQSSMSFLAQDTGGVATFNTNSWQPVLTEIVDGMGSYYSIAYTPRHSGDDRVHQIDVLTPKRKKLRLRHRTTYRDKPTDERMADRLQTALILGRTSNPLAARIDHGEIVAQPGGQTLLVPLRVTVPLEKLVFLPSAGARIGRLRLQLSAKDESGRLAAFHQKQFEVELSPEQGETPVGEHSFVVDLEMRPGDHVVAVGLRDETGRETSYLASKLRVAESASSVAAVAD